MNKQRRKNSRAILTKVTGSTEIATSSIKVEPLESTRTLSRKRKLSDASPKLNVKEESLNEIDGVRQKSVKKVVGIDSKISRNNTKHTKKQQKPNKLAGTVKKSKWRFGKKKQIHYYTVAECISAMRQSSEWPTTECPRFSDEAAKITLCLQTNGKSKQATGRIDFVKLPHPLSFHRSVCLFSNPVDLDIEREALKTLCTAIGVSGESEVLSVPELMVNQKLLNAAMAKFDSFLVTPGMYAKLNPISKEKMKLLRKRIFEVDLSEQPAASLRDALSLSCMWWDAEAKVLSLPVGDSGLLPEELHENITFILEKLHNRRSLFRIGLRSTRATVTIGKGNPWPIYLNELAKQFDKPRNAWRQMHLVKHEAEAEKNAERIFFDFSA